VFLLFYDFNYLGESVLGAWLRVSGSFVLSKLTIGFIVFTWVRMQIENSRKLSHNNLAPKRTWTWMEYDLACMFHSYEDCWFRRSRINIG
jgi:hypothetical protein